MKLKVPAIVVYSIALLLSQIVEHLCCLVFSADNGQLGHSLSNLTTRKVQLKSNEYCHRTAEADQLSALQDVTASAFTCRSCQTCRAGL
jgi:hypothetical protein